MHQDQEQMEKILDIRDHIEAAIRDLRIDALSFSVYEYLLHDYPQLQVSESDKYAFFSRINENFANHLKGLHDAWKKLEQLQDDA